MKSTRALNVLSRTYIFLSAASFLSVSFMAFSDPQAVMNLVQVTLPNNDAFSSIRGVYGGVGLTIGAMLIYWALKNINQGLIFLCLLWGAYAASRLITIAAEGPLGAFGSQWLIIESVFFVLACILLLIRRRSLSYA